MGDVVQGAAEELGQVGAHKELEKEKELVREEELKQSAQELEQKEVQQTDEDAWLSKQVAVCSTY